MFECALDEGAGEALAGQVRFGNLFATWWQRLGFLGPAPRHVLRDLGPQDGGVPLSQAQAATLLDQELGDCGRVHIVGLGKNARALARLLSARGVALSGRDDHLSGAPGWAREDGIDIGVVEPSTPFDAGTRTVVTPLDDKAIVSKLPPGLRALRWNDAPRLAVRRAMRELGAMRVSEVKPLEAGAVA